MNLNITNCSTLIDELKHIWIEHELGPKRMSVTRQTLIGMVYIAIFCTGLLGNLATCIVIARNSFMHTRTNCYLFTLSVSDLLLLIFGLPFELQTVLNESYPWKMGTIFCRFRIFLTELCPLVSILVLTIFSVERYLSICHPFRKILRFSQYDAGHPCIRTSHIHNVNSKTTRSSERISKVPNSQMRNSTQVHCSNNQSHYKRGHTPYIVQINALKSCFLMIICVWIIGSCCAVVIAGLSKVFYAVSLPTVDAFINNTRKDHYHIKLIQSYQTPDCLLNSEIWRPGEILSDSAVCAPSNDSEWAGYISIPVVLQLWTFLFFFTPMVIMSVLYGLIAIQLSHSNLGLRAPSKFKYGRDQSSSCNTSKVRSLGSGRKGIVRMLVAVVVAFFICWAPFHLQRVLTSSNVQMTWFFIDFLFYVSGFLYYMSATVNPILYSLMSARFRRAFISTFKIKQKRTEDTSCIHPIVSTRVIKMNQREQTLSIKEDHQ
ncbi:Neuropeptides capa receptor [Schistosoma japonicum]|uniref:Neuropeptides capa receptor n=1 Tax=Schistosoma japonicum TaxID=6182 RepID=A0A4Z2DMI1_SCHJA|nr:Neuropeptides capa receptor [Schistosoma japonicum]TNN17764.1 Neuropeptides capa receptor [Schistosoma japonicum]